MNSLFLKLYLKFQDLTSREEGQDIVEYALTITMIALAATAGMDSLATAINNVFTHVGAIITGAL